MTKYSYIKNGLDGEVVLDESLTSRLDDEGGRPDIRHVVLVIVNVQRIDDLLLVWQQQTCQHTHQSTITQTQFQRDP